MVVLKSGQGESGAEMSPAQVELARVRRELKHVANAVLGVADALHLSNALRARQLDQIARELLRLAQG